MDVATTPAPGRPSRANLTSDLVGAVARMIGERSLEPGMRLDSQRDLAAGFGVAVPTMREALRQLEGMGVLELRHGSGIYVGRNVNRSVVPNIALPPADREHLVELVEARALIEPAIAARAAEVRSPAAVARLKELLTQAREAVVRREENLWRVNIDLHRAVAAAAGNGLVGEILDSLLLIHAEEQRQILHLHGDPESDLDEHTELVRLVVAGHADAAAAAMRHHLAAVVAAIDQDLERDEQ